MDEYFQRNFVITTSGVEDPLALGYSIEKLGIDNVMWAIDYPYQPTEPAVKFMDDGADVGRGQGEDLSARTPSGSSTSARIGEAFVEPLDPVPHRRRRAALQMRDAADVGGHDRCGAGFCRCVELAVAQRRRESSGCSTE